MKRDTWTAYDSIPIREYVAAADKDRSMALDELLAQAFNAGYDVATSRAESRHRLGLPIEREDG